MVANDIRSNIRQDFEIAVQYDHSQSGPTEVSNGHSVKTNIDSKDAVVYSTLQTN